VVVGILRLTLAIPAAQSLKDKRSVVRRVIGRVRARFNVSMAEVDENDIWQRAVLAAACVSNDRAHVNAQLDKVASEVAQSAEVVAREMEIQSYKDLYGDVG
jgi:uncharacterized protein YlxP (DUF503 family)